MAMGTALFVVAILIIVIWVAIVIKRMKHKMFAVFLIGLLLFFYFSFNLVFQGKNVDFKSISGVTEAGRIYLSWLGTIFTNAKSITMNAIKMDWKGNVSAGG